MLTGVAGWRRTDVSRAGAALLAATPASVLLAGVLAVFHVDQFIAILGPYGLAWTLVGYDVYRLP